MCGYSVEMEIALTSILRPPTQEAMVVRLSQPKLLWRSRLKPWGFATRGPECL